MQDALKIIKTDARHILDHFTGCCYSFLQYFFCIYRVFDLFSDVA